MYVKKLNTIPGAANSINSTYINKHRGSLTLFIDGLEVKSKTFYSKQERKDLMIKWQNDFKKIAKYVPVHFIISHFEFSRVPDKYIMKKVS